MLDLAPLRGAPLLEPGVEGIKIREAGQWLPQTPAGILHILFHLTLFPARGRIAELGLEQVMAGHGREPGVDLPGLARADPVDRSLHVVEDAATRHPAQNPERLGHRVEQHLVGLQQIGPHDERPAVRQLGMGHLQLDTLAAKQGPVFAPVELEGLARPEHQGNEGAAPAGLLLLLPPGLPGPHERCDALIRALIAQNHKVRMHLPGRAALLARFTRFHAQPVGELLRKPVRLAGPCRHLEPGLHRVGPQILADRVARQSRAPLDLPDRHPLTEVPAPDYAQ